MQLRPSHCWLDTRGWTCISSGARQQIRQRGKFVTGQNQQGSVCRTSRIVEAVALAAMFGTHWLPALAAPGADSAGTGGDQANSENLAEITVTATRRAQNITDVPYNISAISGSDLTVNNIIDFSKLTQAIPGLQMTDRGIRDNTANARLISRGLNTESSAFSDVPFVTVSPVAMYIDETPAFVNLRIDDVQRVEFLRGPQGTLYGSGSLGGTLRFIYNKPDPSAFTWHAETSGSATQNAEGPNWSVNGLINAPLGDHAAIRMSGGQDFYQGFINAPHVATLGANGVALPADPSNPLASPPLTHSEQGVNWGRVNYARAAVRLLPADGVDVQLDYHYQSENTGGRDAQGIGIPGLGQFESPTLLPEPSTRDIDLVSATVDADLNFAALTSSSSYFHGQSESVTDGTGYYGTFGFLLAPRYTAPITIGTRQDVFVQELRLVSKTPGPLDWLVGLYFQHESNLDIDEHDYFEGDNLLGNPQTGSDNLFLHLQRHITFQDEALYGQLTYHLTPQWQVTGGMRALHDKFSSDSDLTFPAYPTTPAQPNSFNNNKVLFMVDTGYRLSDAANLYATFSQGYRRGGANAIPTQGPLAEPAGLVSYNPDSVNNYEIGVKGVVPQGVRYTAGLYYIDWRDAQVGILTPKYGYDAGVNAGKVRSQGIELEASGSAGRHINFSAGFALTDAYLVNGFSNYAVGQAGARLPGVSKYTASAELTYMVPLTKSDRLDFHLDGSYRSSFVNSTDSTSAIYRQFGGRGFLGATISWLRGPCTISLYGENLLNKLGESAQNDPSIVGNAYFVEWVARPRTIGIRLAYQP
jgi:iron complex outermembrane receptor protein